MSADLQSLLARVEAASGPDRLLDAEIEVAARWIDAARAGLAPEHRARWRVLTGLRVGAVESQGTSYNAKPFTASVDAALALVERVLPGWQWDVGYLPNQPEIGFLAEIWPPGDPVNDVSGAGKTAPLAILAALLKAKIAQGGEA